MEKYKFLDDIATADSAFEAYGKDLNELFENAALATFETMVNLDSVEPKIKKEFEEKGSSKEMLLLDFLSDLIFTKDIEGMVFSKAKVEISEENKEFKLKAEIWGDLIDPEKQELKVDVKAVTMYKLKVEEIKQGYKATVVLDV